MNSSHLMRGRLSCALIASLLIFGPATAVAQTHPVQTNVDMEVPAEPSTAPVTMTMALDASDAVRGLLHVHETIGVTPGALTLVYPKWIPGEHAPSGPIANVAALTITAGGTKLPWRRDLVDMFAYHLVVPAGATSIDVTFDYLGAQFGDYSANRLVTPNMLSITWNKFLLYPFVANEEQVTVSPSIVLPGAAWKFATALETASQQGASVTFKPLTADQLIDSPLDAGINERVFALGDFDGAPVRLDVFADTPAELAAPDATIDKFRRLVKEMKAVYGARHFNHYDFLLTVSDEWPGEGVEHHQSSDNGTDGNYLIDGGALKADGDLLAHEFNHSWDGKFRRPYDLATPNLQAAMEDDLLWVYEGMTQFYGYLQATRAGLWDKDDYFNALATDYAELDTESGRLTRPLQDTADGAPFTYGAPGPWTSIRRSVDFYTEGDLMWLEADGIIQRLSHGKKSIEDFARAFFGQADSGPKLVPYHRADIVAALQAVQPYDWEAFFTKRINDIAPHPPDPFDQAGWHLTYTDEPTAAYRARLGQRHALDARYSLGIVGAANGTIGDVLQGSPAQRAGIGPGQKIIAVDGRATDNVQAALDEALKASKGNAYPITLLLLGGGVYTTAVIDYHGGARYPRLVRVAGTPDLLSGIAAPR